MWYSQKEDHILFMDNQPFNPHIVIETDRLLLRYLKESDRHDIFTNINNDKEVLRYFLDQYLEDETQLNLSKRISFCLANERYFFAIELKKSHEIIGMIFQCSTPEKNFNSSEVGYAIGKKYWNKGYASEAFRGMIDFLFSLGINKVFAAHLLGNDASKRVMEKCGLIYEGRRIKEVYYHEQYHDVDYYYLINPRK